MLMRVVGYFANKAGKSVFRRARTWWPSCTISPDCSEFEMKDSGGTSPSSGSVQRERASKPTVISLENWIRGWYSKCRSPSPFAGTRCRAFCAAGVDGDMVLGAKLLRVRRRLIDRADNSIFDRFGLILINATIKLVAKPQRGGSHGKTITRSISGSFFYEACRQCAPKKYT